MIPLLQKINAFLKKEWHFPHAEKLNGTIDSFTLTEKLVFYFFFFVMCGTGLFILAKVNDAVSVEVKIRGGSLTEGIVGTPRFINPLLAISDADRDLAALTYSGLMRTTTSGDLVPDLAKSYSVSDDGLTYDFILKDGLTFQDGTPLTADDVIFTIQKAQDSDLKSPKRANWQGVTAEKVSGTEVRLTLKKAYSPFLSNATLGILPKHIWENVETGQFAFSDFNIQPVGSGPYEVSAVQRASSGAPLSYDLAPFDHYAGDAPYISKLTFRFFSSDSDLFDALNSGAVESVSAVSPDKLADLKNADSQIETAPSSRIFGVFFNQNQAPVFAYKEVRQALDMALDKQDIVNQVLHGYGKVINGPVPPGSFAGGTDEQLSSAGTTTDRMAEAKALLEKNGWAINPTSGIYEKKVSKKETIALSFSLTTSAAAELKSAAEIAKARWEKLGAKVDIKVFELGDLNQNVIRPRSYDALLFGEIVGRDLDLFAFWHSSQRLDPGLNIALYTNAKADKLLETARVTEDEAKRDDIYRQFEASISDDTPAIFLYSPDFIYVVPRKIRGFSIGQVTVSSERFADVVHWYAETEKVWRIFGGDQTSQ